RRFRQEAELWSQSLPEIPRLAHEALALAAAGSRTPSGIEKALIELNAQLRQTRRWLLACVLLIAILLAGAGLLLSGVIDLDSIEDTTESQTLTRTQQPSTVWRRLC
ncbi:MAG: hypothetical protein EBW20_09425, partial [Betaproteobacteria bacterium]|nr:hypothetical protein [Betaproteobacteria bacterium]